MFLLTYLSPQHNIIIAYLHFPNCFTIINMYRPILFLINCGTNHSHSILALNVLILIILVIMLIKSPIITWRFNEISQIFVSVIIWTILCRLMSLINQKELIVIAYFFGIPTFSLFMIWILQIRILSVLKR